MVGVGGASRADQTGLRSHEFEVGFVAEPARLAERQDALVDLAGSGNRARSASSMQDRARQSSRNRPPQLETDIKFPQQCVREQPGVRAPVHGDQGFRFKATTVSGG
jgi:hypothetical protein